MMHSSDEPIYKSLSVQELSLLLLELPPNVRVVPNAVRNLALFDVNDKNEPKNFIGFIDFAADGGKVDLIGDNHD